MKYKIMKKILLFTVCTLFALSSCDDREFYGDGSDYTSFKLSTPTVSDTTGNSATITSTITGLVKSTSTQGFYVSSTNGDPYGGEDGVTTIECSTTTSPGSTLAYPISESLTGLSELTTYYVRAFLLQEGVYYYSKVDTFTTLEGDPEVVSIEVTTAPTRNTYYYYVSDATAGMAERSLTVDMTGMVVVANYDDGTQVELSNNDLTYSTTVPAEEGTHKVTITSSDGFSTTTDIKVVLTDATNVHMKPTILGAEDNTTGFWGVLADDVNIPAGETYAVNFTNYTNGANNYNNFVVILRNSDLTKEYAVFRADNYGWSVYNQEDYNSNVIFSSGQSDWAAWLAAMNGAEVTVYVTNCNNSTAEIQMIMNGNDGNTYTQYYLNIPDIDSDDLGMTFTIDGSHIVFK